MHQSCSINDTKSNNRSVFYSVALVFGNVEFTVSNKIILAFEFRVGNTVLLKARTLKTTDFLKTRCPSCGIPCDKICFIYEVLYTRSGPCVM